MALEHLPRFTSCIFRSIPLSREGVLHDCDGPLFLGGQFSSMLVGQSGSFPSGSGVKCPASAGDAGDMGSIPSSGRTFAGRFLDPCILLLWDTTSDESFCFCLFVF